jgi:comEA protein
VGDRLDDGAGLAMESSGPVAPPFRCPTSATDYDVANGAANVHLEEQTMRVVLMLLAVAAMAVIPAAAAQQAKETPAPAKSTRNAAAKASPAPTTPINLNTATQAQLESLPGVGPKAAERILEYRKQNGSFKKIEDLMNVKGFGEKTFLKLKPMITTTDKATSGSSL